MSGARCVTTLHAVLIETLWNVKEQKPKQELKPEKSINRNIMECKECQQKPTWRAILRINRNIMECKDITTRAAFDYVQVLIETLWNVKKSGNSNY